MSGEWVKEIRSMSGVDKALKDIQDNLDNDAAAHIREDHLYLGILKGIASGRVKDPQAMAKKVLDVETMAFERWFE